MTSTQTIPESTLSADNSSQRNGNGLPHFEKYGEYMTTEEAARYLRRSVSFVLRQKNIPYLPGHPNSYRRKDLDEWFEKNKRTPLMN